MLEVLVEVLDDKGFAIRPAFRYQRAEGDLLALQQRIASDVAATLVPSAQASLTAAPPTPTAQNENANRLVLFGNHYDHEVRDDFILDEQKMDKAISYFERATAADPNSITAHARLASALLYKGDVNEARAPLLSALKLAESADPTPHLRRFPTCITRPRSMTCARSRAASKTHTSGRLR